MNRQFRVSGFKFQVGKRLRLLLAVLASGALAGVTPLAPAPAALAQAPDPSSITRTYTAAINTRDVDGALALFADDAVLIAPGGERSAGKELIRTRLVAAVAGNPHETIVEPPRTTGDRVTWVRDRADDSSRNLGVSPLRSTLEAILQGGRIRSLRATLTPDSEARLQAAEAVLGVVLAFENAQNTGDVEAAVALFAEDAVGVTADGERFVGRDRIRAAVLGSVAGRARIERIRYQVSGDRVTSLVTLTSQGLRAQGVGGLQVQAEALVRDGKIVFTSSSFTPESAGRLQAAQNRGVADRVLEAFNAHDVDGIVALLAPTYVDRDARPDQDPGPEGARAALADLFRGAPNATATVDATLTERDLLSVRFTVTATHTGELHGIPPTGREFTVTVAHIWRIQNGKIVEGWGNMDQLGLLRQLGAMP